ncbi:MAG: hypothetical protein A2252_00385 [Elusimicrobia bacterium RIFOXYA2_FULL_39_19]|nr:MAG: hypothetical protein A2252_00385 [Elusimicrobia bacterium RIFOXYA2_FULL_39_19]
MPQAITVEYIRRLGRPVFTTRELSDISGKSMSTVSQALAYLSEHTIVKKIYRGVWVEVGGKLLSPYMVVPHLFRGSRVYVSFLSALHLHGIIEQIPQVITLASTAHTRKITTTVGTFLVHKISSQFFSGFEWYKGTGSFLVAEPEKALADCLYLFTRKKKQYGFFPELNLKKPFDVKKAREWIQKIPDKKALVAAEIKLEEIIKKRNN